MIEDTHTSYWAEYNGGYFESHEKTLRSRFRRPNTAIEWSKGFVDQLNAYVHLRGYALTQQVLIFQFGNSFVRYHSKSDDFKRDVATDTVGGLHFYDSIFVFEKRVRVHLKWG